MDTISKPDLKRKPNHDKFKRNRRAINFLVVKEIDNKGDMKNPVFVKNFSAGYVVGNVFELTGQRYVVTANRLGNQSGLRRIENEH